MREPWENVTVLRPQLDRIETNAQFVQIMNPTEMVALVTFQAKIGEVEGLMNLCIPHMVVEPVMSKLSTKIWFSMIEKGTSEETKHAIGLKVEETIVPLTAVLGKTHLLVSEFLQLHNGRIYIL
jgi:flagellar motor switch protein FliM